MIETWTPETEAQVVEAIQWAVSTETRLSVLSRGTKLSIGGVVDAPARLQLNRLCGVSLYEPEELVLRVGPGTPLAELEELLARHGQMLPFEPPRFHKDAGTIGGIVGTNLAGPRRFKAGAVRDYVLGIRGVSGFGEPFKSGGRVMKNVSGYDLSKLMTGSFGTLAALTEITLKVLPRPESETTLVVRAMPVDGALKTMTSIVSSALEPSGLAFLPESAASRSAAIEPGSTALAIRLEGPAVSLDERARGFEKLNRHSTTRLDPEGSAALWREVRDAALMPLRGCLWRVSVPPQDAVRAIDANRPDQWALDWAGGLIWMRFDDAARVPTVASGGGLRIRNEIGAQTASPGVTLASEGVQRLAKRIKASFDPNNLLNPGRMGEGAAV